MAFSHELPNKGKTNVWLTPKYIIDALGEFDLDPCAAPEPRPWPTAKRHITESQNGLCQKWEGTVWLNPPYGPEVEIWMDKLVDHGDGIALVFARTETRWFQKIIHRADLLFFPAGRINFCYPDGSKSKSNSGTPSVLIAFGEKAKQKLLGIGLHGFYSEQL